MKKSNKQFIREYIKALSGKPKTPDLLKKYIAESDMELMNHVIAFERGVPNYEIQIEDIIEEGDKVVVNAIFKGIHKGKLFGQPATNNPVHNNAIVIYQMKDEKIINHWFQADSLSLMQQIGAMKTNEETTEKQ